MYEILCSKSFCLSVIISNNLQLSTQIQDIYLNSFIIYNNYGLIFTTGFIF